jgi:hypothetical protein
MANGSYIKNGRLNHGAKINPCSVSTQNLIWPFRIRFPRFPHDGKKLAVTKSVSNISVSVMDADGTNVKLIFRADEGAVALAPEWSPKDLGWWPIFNSADVSITIGVLIALWFLR